ncbi:MAG: calcium-binding protein, partial [Nitrospira sp.]|nr:calcium-binding protein [Nitrospira sp.]
MATMIGTNGNNILNGTISSDTMIGRAGNDQLSGNGGDDRLNGGTGNDLLNGGTGNDTADYSNIVIGGTTYLGATAGVKVNLNLLGAQNTGGAGLDQLVSIENLIGTNFNDTLTGNSANNGLLGLAGNDSLNGGSGDDWLIGGTGNDLLNGGAGIDTADYRNRIGGIGATAGVTVNLNLTGAQNTGGAGSDTLVSIENLTGTTSYNDTLTGNGANNVLSGENGNDTLNGGSGNDTLHGGGNNDQLFGGNGNDVLSGGSGNDLLNGGAGLDTASYATATAGVKVIFDFLEDPDGPQNTGGAGLDTLVSIENLTGSNFNDTLRVSFPDTDTSTLNGGAGNDVLLADHVNAMLNGGTGNDTLDVEDATGTLNGGAGDDELRGMSFFGGTFNGEDGNDVLTVLTTFDHSTLNGGAGNDTLNAIDADATLNGGTGNDRLTADFSEGTLNGGNGNDVLKVVGPKPDAGDSTMTGGAGTDTFIFDPGGANFGKVIVTDFAGAGVAIGDRIDLTTIDANSLAAGNQAFIFGGSFTAGHLRYVGGVLQGNT